MAQTLAAVFKLTDQYTATMQKIIQSSDAYEKKQQQAKKATDQFKSSLSGIKSSSVSATAGIEAITAKIGKLASAAYIGKKAIGLLFGSIKEGAQEQVQLNNFQALVGNDKAGTALFNYASEYSKKSALDRINTEKAITGFLPYTKDINQIEQLIKLTERLYAKDPTQGAEGATFALKEAFAGDVMSLRNRFNMTGISGEKIRALSNSGDISGTIKYLDETFNKFGATQEIVDKNFKSLAIQSNIFATNFKAAMADEANPAVQNLSLLMQQLNEDMDAGKFQPFFDVMAKGATAICNGMAWVAQNADVLAPIIGGVITAIVAYNAAMLLARTVSLVTGTAISIVAGNWIKAAALIAGAAATIGIATSLAKQNDDLKKTTDSLTKAKNDYNSSLKDTKFQKTIPVEISNKAPISVKGEVEIEKESQKYLFEAAAAKVYAQLNVTKNTPTVIIENQNVTKEADLDEIDRRLGNIVSEQASVSAEGNYA